MSGRFSLSIRWRIQLWHCALLMVITTALLVAFYQHERRLKVRALEERMTGPLISLLPRYVAPPDGRRPPPPPGRGGDEGDFERRLEAQGYYVGVWGPEGRLRFRSRNAPADLERPGGEDGGAELFGQWSGANYELVQRTPHDDVLVLGISGAEIEAEMQRTAINLLLVGLGVTAVGFLGGWWVTGRAMRPIADIAATAERISEGAYKQRIELRNSSDELGRLAGVLNGTFDRMGEAYDQQVRFVANASHELRTPVAIILTKTQMILARARTKEEYAEALVICQRAAERMRGLLASLLDLSRQDAAPEQMRREDGELAVVVREAVEFVQPLAEERGVGISTELEPVRGSFSADGMSVVLLNLLTNAISHNPPGTSLEVTLAREGTLARLVVADSGGGIPAEAVPHVFERFYRVDKSRSRATGGSGLGLSIAEGIVRAHGGRIEVESVVGKGTAFRVWLPVGDESVPA